MTAVGDRILERLKRIPMNGLVLGMEIGVEPAELDAEIKALEASAQIRRLNGKYHVITPAAPAAADPETTVSARNEEKVCTGACGESKPLDQFYDRQSQCKRCVLDRQKALKDARARGVAAAPQKKGGGARKPKSPAPAKPKSAGAKPNGLPVIEDLAVIHIASGFRLGPLHKSVGGLISMPYHVDLSFAQLDELAELRNAVKESS